MLGEVSDEFTDTVCHVFADAERFHVLGGVGDALVDGRLRVDALEFHRDATVEGCASVPCGDAEDVWVVCGCRELIDARKNVNQMMQVMQSQALVGPFFDKCVRFLS